MLGLNRLPSLVCSWSNILLLTSEQEYKSKSTFPQFWPPSPQILLYAYKSQNSLGPPHFYDQLQPCIALWCLGSADQPHSVDLNTKLKEEGIRFWQFQPPYSETNCLYTLDCRPHCLHLNFTYPFP